MNRRHREINSLQTFYYWRSTFYVRYTLYIHFVHRMPAGSATLNSMHTRSALPKVSPLSSMSRVGLIIIIAMPSARVHSLSSLFSFSSFCSFALSFFSHSLALTAIYIYAYRAASTTAYVKCRALKNGWCLRACIHS